MIKIYAVKEKQGARIAEIVWSKKNWSVLYLTGYPVAYMTRDSKTGSFVLVVQTAKRDMQVMSGTRLSEEEWKELLQGLKAVEKRVRGLVESRGPKIEPNMIIKTFDI